MTGLQCIMVCDRSDYTSNSEFFQKMELLVPAQGVALELQLAFIGPKDDASASFNPSRRLCFKLLEMAKLVFLLPSNT